MSIYETKKFKDFIQKHISDSQKNVEFIKDYKFNSDKNAFHIWLPDNVITQKHLIHLVAKAAISEKFEVEVELTQEILKYAHKNNQPFTSLDIDLVELDLVVGMYQNMLILPLFIRSQAGLNKSVEKILGLN